MFSIERGDLFAPGSQALVNPVNTVGVMGAGLAAEFKRRYPEMFTQYVVDCRTGRVRPGKIGIYRLPSPRPIDPLFILNFPTKRHWLEVSRLEVIQTGLENLKGVIGYLQLTSLAIPALGCGYGGLNWPDVQALILEILEPVTACQIKLFPPR